MIVSCNGKFHSFLLGSALEKKNSLDRLYTTYYSRKDKRWSRWIRRDDREDISLSRVRTNLLPEIPMRVGGRIAILERYMPYLKAVWFDRWVAANLKRESASDVFMGWSNSSIASLYVAKARGMRTIVTRGSSHIKYQNALLIREYAKRGVRYRPPYGIERRELLEYELADYIRIPSSYVRRTFLNEGVKDSKLLQVSYAADLKHFHVMPREFSPNFRVLLLNAVTIQKGFYYALEAIQRIKETGPRGIEFWFVGQPEYAIDRSLRQLCATSDNVRAFGRVDHHELARWICQCDVGVFPTIQEGMANTILQTMACGLPVVATVNSGAEDLVDNNEEGFIVPIMDAEVLTERILWCFEHQTQVRKMGKAAAARIGRRSWEDVVDEMLEKLR